MPSSFPDDTVKLLSYIYGDGSVRCACRGKSDPGRRSDNIGFRVVCVAPSL